MPSLDDSTPYDAILFLSFGGPEGREDVIPFLENVLRVGAPSDSSLVEMDTLLRRLLESAPDSLVMAMRGEPSTFEPLPTTILLVSPRKTQAYQTEASSCTSTSPQMTAPGAMKAEAWIFGFLSPIAKIRGFSIMI